MIELDILLLLLWFIESFFNLPSLRFSDSDYLVYYGTFLLESSDYFVYYGKNFYPPPKVAVIMTFLLSLEVSLIGDFFS